MKRKIGVGTFITTLKMREYVNRVLDTGWVSSSGPFCRWFENDFAEIHRCSYGVLSNSGTSSLQVALQALKEVHGWQDGDEVIIPAITFVATVNIVIHCRLTPVLVDVDAYTYNINPHKIRAAITDRSRCIIPVHTFGQPANMPAIKEIAEQYHLKIIEDSCETMFASYGQLPVGSWGDIGCFSMYVAHILTAGVGGIAITNNPQYAAVMRSLVNHGRDGIFFEQDGGDAASLKEVAKRRFRFERIGHSFRITEFEAALAMAQLEDWAELVNARRRNAHYLTRNLAALEGYLTLPFTAPEADHSYMMYPILVKAAGGDKWALIDHLESKGIETREMLPLTNQPCYQGRFREDDYPIAQIINQTGFYIGCHHGLTQNDLDCMIDTLYGFFGVARPGIKAEAAYAHG